MASGDVQIGYLGSSPLAAAATRKLPVETFLIATREEGTGEAKLEVYSPNSPLGGALINAKVGETREYNLPNGGTMKVTLVSAEPYHS